MSLRRVRYRHPNGAEISGVMERPIPRTLTITAGDPGDPYNRYEICLRLWSGRKHRMRTRRQHAQQKLRLAMEQE